MDRWQTRWIGDSQHPDFLAPVQWLSANTCLRLSNSAAAALDELRDVRAIQPDVVVVAQTRPGQFSAQQVEDVLRLAPSARPVALLGSLCEGEQRSGKPWPGVPRIYWYDWQPRFERELFGGREGPFSQWRQPRTWTDVDAALHTYSPQPMPMPSQQVEAPRKNGVIAIQSSDPNTKFGLAEACVSYGFVTTLVEGVDHVESPMADLLIYDGDCLDERGTLELALACQRFAPTPVLILLNFPRSQDYRRAAEAGAAAIVSKPFQLTDLFWHVDRLMLQTSVVRKTSLRRIA